MAFKKLNAGTNTASDLSQAPGLRKQPERTLTVSLIFSADQRFDIKGRVVFALSGRDVENGKAVHLDMALGREPSEAEMAPWRKLRKDQQVTVRGRFASAAANARFEIETLVAVTTLPDR